MVKRTVFTGSGEGVAYLWSRCIIMAKIRRCIIAGITVLVHCTMYNYVIETNLDTPACAVYLNKCSVCWVKKNTFTTHNPLATCGFP